MDWNKVKTILIIALIILNICLFTYVYVFNGGNGSNENMLTVSRVEEILSEKNISINCTVPNDSISLPSLDIKFKTMTPTKELINNFLENYVGVISDENTSYSQGQETLNIIGNKKLEYVNASINNANGEASIIDIAKDYCQEKNIDISNYVLEVFNNEDSVEVAFTKQFKNYKLDNSYVRFYFVDKNITKIQIQEIEEIAEKAQVQAVSAVEALLRLMSYEDVSNKEITAIELCYFTAEDQDFLQITSTNTKPVWKVKFSDNSYKYLYSMD